MELEEPHPSKLVGRVETRTGWSHIHVWWIKIQEGYLRGKESQPHTRLSSPGFSVRKISPHNFWLQKPVGIELVEETFGVPSSFS